MRHITFQKSEDLIYTLDTWRVIADVVKGGDTLSSRHVSSCDITREVGM